MCGRFTLTTDDYHAVAAALSAEIAAEDAHAYRPRFNVAPGDLHWAVATADGTRRRMVPAHWGLPGPADRPAPRGCGHINARAETIHTRPAFREAFRHRRCVIPADGFYEWTGPKDHRLPIWFHPDHRVIALAGIYAEHVDRHTGEVQLRFSIVTTEANARVAAAHDRMPVILPKDAIGPWIEPAATDAELTALRDLLRPAPEDLLIATEVSSRVNSVRYDDPACIAATPHPRQESLF
jgi:putative SOS response-associated peptidase YedK